MRSDEILTLVKVALLEIDEKPIAVTLRRCVRIANLQGESKAAIRFSLELRPFRGSKIANGDDMRGFLEDPDIWQSKTGPHEDAFREFFDDRKEEGAEKIQAHTASEIEYLLNLMASESKESLGIEFLKTEQHQRALLETIRMRAFSALCKWERQLTFANVNEQIFRGFKTNVDSLLAQYTPDIVNGFNAVYSRLREANLSNSGGSEELSQAVTSCRRILKATADYVHPPTDIPSEDGHILDDPKYRNRIKEFVKEKTKSENKRKYINVEIDSLYDRFAALDNLTNKGVHSDIAIEEAELCAISTYIIAGELLRLNKN